MKLLQGRVVVVVVEVVVVVVVVGQSVLDHAQFTPEQVAPLIAPLLLPYLQLLVVLHHPQLAATVQSGQVA